MSEVQEQKVKQPDEVFCGECGKIIKAKAEICPKCGVRQESAPYHSDKNKTIAALLALFWGGIGAHKFYLGRIGWGIVYLVFFWTVIPTLISFIEFIILLATDEKTFNKKYATE